MRSDKPTNLILSKIFPSRRGQSAVAGEEGRWPRTADPASRLPLTAQPPLTGHRFLGCVSCNCTRGRYSWSSACCLSSCAR
jgi:hypothetical protein